MKNKQMQINRSHVILGLLLVELVVLLFPVVSLFDELYGKLLNPHSIPPATEALIKINHTLTQPLLNGVIAILLLAGVFVGYAHFFRGKLVIRANYCFIFFVNILLLAVAYILITPLAEAFHIYPWCSCRL